MRDDHTPVPAIPVVLLTLALAMSVLTASCSDEAAAEPENETITTLPVERRDIVMTISASGTMEPIVAIHVKSKAEGVVLRTPVQTGDEVERGALLAMVDTTEAAARLRREVAMLDYRRASLRIAERGREGARNLLDKGIISSEEDDEVVFPCLVRVDNSDGRLFPGMTCSADIRIARLDSALAVPSYTIVSPGDALYVAPMLDVAPGVTDSLLARSGVSVAGADQSANLMAAMLWGQGMESAAGRSGCGGDTLRTIRVVDDRYAPVNRPRSGEFRSRGRVLWRLSGVPRIEAPSCRGAAIRVVSPLGHPSAANANDRSHPCASGRSCVPVVLVEAT